MTSHPKNHTQNNNIRLKTGNLAKYLLLMILLSAGVLWYWLFFLNQYFIEGIPHVGDAVSYVIQAKFLASGKLFIEPSIFPKYYDFFKAWEPIFYRNGKWFGPYPFGHPLLLAIGVLLGNVGIIPPLIGTLTAVILYFIGKNLGSLKTGIIAFYLTAFSPFFQMHSVSFMSHSSGAFYTSLAMLFLTWKNKRWYFPIIAGFAWGFLFNTRPLTSAAFIIPLLLMTVYFYKSYKSILFFILGTIPPLVFFLLANLLITGNPFSSPINMIDPVSKMFPLLALGHFSVEFGNFAQSADLFFQVIFGWPKYITLAVFIISLIFIREKKIILINLFAIASCFILYSFYFTTAIIYGPRYVYETLPFFILVIALGISQLVKHVKFSALRVGIYCFIIILTVRTIIGWLTEKPLLYSYYFTPSSVTGLYRLNSADARLIKKAEELNINHAVILVKTGEECGWQWWCYGSVMPQNNLSFDSNIVWGIDLGSRNYELVNLYPDRKFYLADYNNHLITPLPIY